MHSSQRSFDDLGTPLHDVTFCIFDVETTGGNPQTCFITEIGAVKVRAGEVIGTFQTLVNPGCAIPPNITVLTGITDSLVMRAPSMDQVLPSFLEFMGGAVVVGHNVRFDWSFLSAAVQRWGGPMLGNQRVDTLGLARRLLADEMPRFGLGELSKRLRLPHQPTHRALDDAWATTDLLHVLIERASAWGVTGLDDLVALPTIAGHPQWRKLSLTNDIPRSPGVYLFHDRDDRILYVGKATDLRSRVRSYFSSDRRRKVHQLLRETHRISHRVCHNTLEAELLEMRMIHRFQPRFNRRNKKPISPCWVRLTNEAFPRLSIVRKDPGAVAHLGPFPSRAEAKIVVEALHAAFPIRRCSTKVGRRGFEPTDAPCTAAQLGVAMCPCSGACSEAEYDRVVQSVTDAFAGNTDLILYPLEAHMHRLAEAERFEEAADMRNRAEAIARIVGRQRRIEMLAQIDQLIIEDGRGMRIRITSGGQLDSSVLDASSPAEAPAADDASIMTDPAHQPATLDEALCVASWLQRNAAGVTLVASEGLFASPLPGLPDFKPAAAQASSRPKR